MPDIRKSLLQFVFAGAFMKRWNDKLRPMELLEVDKQAHKMIAAWILFQLNSEGLSREKRLALGETIVEGGLFEYFYRLVITDIKPPVFYRIKANPEHHSRLTQWVLKQLEPRVKPLGPELWGRLEKYLGQEDEADLGRRILTAAHLYASYWEFNLIKGLNPDDDEFKEIDSWFVTGLEDHADLAGVGELMQGAKSPPRPVRQSLRPVALSEALVPNPPGAGDLGHRPHVHRGQLRLLFQSGAGGLQGPPPEQLFRRAVPRPARNAHPGHYFAGEAVRGGHRRHHQGIRAGRTATPGPDPPGARRPSCGGGALGVFSRPGRGVGVQGHRGGGRPGAGH